MLHKIYWYVITDESGDKRSYVVDETCDIIHVSFTESINHYYFESEAYHLPSWCRDNNLKCESGEMEITLPV